MKSQRILILILILATPLFIRMSCDEEPDPGVPFPYVPVNYSEINTEYDDYNSAFPYYGEVFPLCFSSNRNSAGENYDIVYKLTTVWIAHEDKSLRLFEETSTNLDIYMVNQNIKTGLSKINTTSDEFGPFLIPGERYESYREDVYRYQSYLILYSSDKGGNQDIYYTEDYSEEDYTDPAPVVFLNSEYNDAYPSLNSEFYPSEIFFASDRDGSWDIYRVETDSSLEVLSLVSSTPDFVAVKDTVLSSDAEDTCPYILDDFMIFTSDRPGGYGGFDLYYSIRTDSTWSDPVNLGADINSEYDEFRPVVRQYYMDYFMFFSSNRPGGKGGFDLYYVGYPVPGI